MSHSLCSSPFSSRSWSSEHAADRPRPALRLARCTRRARARTSERAVVICVIAAIAVLAVRNATVYPAIAGYDAVEAIEYARGLVEDGRLPEGTGSYYTPPGFFAVGGVGDRDRRGPRPRPPGARRSARQRPRRGRHGAAAARARAPALAGTPRPPHRGCRVLRRLPCGDEVRCDVPPGAARRCCSRRRPSSSPRVSSFGPTTALQTAALLGVTLGLAQLVRAWTLWTVGAVLLVLLVATVTRA